MGVNCSNNKCPDYVIHDIRDALNYKVVILGDTGVGKTSVFKKYVDQSFDNEHRPTKKPVVKNVFQKVNVPDDYVASITLWDLPSFEDLDMRESYYRNVDAVIVVVDMTDPSTIRMAGTWRQDFVNKASKIFTVTEVLPNGHTMTTMEKATFDPYTVPFLLLGNKYDKIEEQLQEEKLKKLLKNSLLSDMKSPSLGNDESVSVIPGLRDDNKDTHLLDNCDDEQELKPKCVIELEDVEEKYNFIGSMLVSAKLSDSSVDLAFQSLLRHLLDKSRPEKLDLPTEHEDITEPSRPQKIGRKDKYISYCGVEDLDDIFHKCYTPVKRADDLDNYYGMLLSKFQQTCLDNGFIYDAGASLEDCIVSINRAMYDICKVHLKVEECGSFICLGYTDLEEEAPEEVHATLKLFNNEFVAVCQTIQKESPILDSIFISLQASLTKITSQLTRKYHQEAGKYVDICHRNQARISFAKKQASHSLVEVENMKAKINAALIW